MERGTPACDLVAAAQSEAGRVASARTLSLCFNDAPFTDQMLWNSIPPCATNIKLIGHYTPLSRS
jgi:hypothetical protein